MLPFIQIGHFRSRVDYSTRIPLVSLEESAQACSDAKGAFPRWYTVFIPEVDTFKPIDQCKTVEMRGTVELDFEWLVLESGEAITEAVLGEMDRRALRPAMLIEYLLVLLKFKSPPRPRGVLGSVANVHGELCVAVDHFKSPIEISRSCLEAIPLIDIKWPKGTSFLGVRRPS